MAIPPEYSTSKLEGLRPQAIKAILNNSGSPETNLTKEHEALIGAYITIYNYIELNMRLCVRAYRKLGILTNSKSKKPYSTDLPKLIKQAIGKLDLSIELEAEATAKLNEIALRQPLRNMLAHWAARRIPNTDALVLMNADEKDALQVGASFEEADEISYAILDVADLRGLIPLMKEYEVWIAIHSANLLASIKE